MVATEERPFPRGPLKPAEATFAREKRPKREKDLFSTRLPEASTKPPKKWNKKKKNAADAVDADEGGFSVVQAEQLSYGQLSEGMLVLGRVSNVREFDLRVSLPGRLVATVPITAVSAAYTEALKALASDGGEGGDDVKPLREMFAPGQVVACCVSDVRQSEDGFHRVKMSLDPRDVNGDVGDVPARLVCAVRSVEDRGYAMDAGIEGLRAVLPKNNDENFSVGQLVPCAVSTKDEVTATLLADPAKVRSCRLSDCAGVSVRSLLPGTTVANCVVTERRIRNGVQVAFPNSDLVGYIHNDHLDEGEAEPGRKLDAHVLYVVPTANTVYLSAKPSLGFGMMPKDPFGVVKVGELVKDGEVVRSNAGGILLRFGGGASVGFVSAKNLKEGGGPKVGERCPVRVLEYDYADEMFICSGKKSALKEAPAKMENLRVGSRVTAVLKRAERRGLVVTVGGRLEGFVPSLHVSDVPMTRPEGKFSVGERIRCRVLKVDPGRRRLHLTAKSILVNEDYPVVDSFDKDNVGKVTEGVVVSISGEGLLLQLFGEARGWVPKKFVSSEGPIDYPEKLFFIGQCLKCRVVDVDEKGSRMTLSLILGGKSRPMGSREKGSGRRMKLGGMYPGGKVVDVLADGLTVEVEVEDEATPVKAFLPKNHLSDSAALSEDLLASYSAGDLVEGSMMCFERDVLPIMTLKPMIVNEVANNGSGEKGFDDVLEGDVLPGVVCMVKPYGVFLRLPTFGFRKSALVPTRHLAEQFVEDPAELYSMHETVVAKVVERNDKEQKLTMSSKLRDVCSEASDVSLLESTLADLEALRTRNGVDLEVGTIAKAEVTAVTEFGVEAWLPELDVKALVPRSSLASDVPEVGQAVRGVVLDVEARFRCVEMSLDPELVARVAGRKGARPKEGQHVRASVVLRRSRYGYVVACVKAPGHASGHLVHVPTLRHLNDRVGFDETFAMNETYPVEVKSCRGGFAVGVVVTTSRRPKRQREILDEAPDDAVKLEVDCPSNPRKKRRLHKNKNVNVSVLDDLAPAPDVKVEVKEEVLDDLPGARNAPWDGDFNPWEEKEEEEVKAEDEPEKAKRKKSRLSKREAKELRRLEDSEIAMVEESVDAGSEPRTAKDFERLVLGSPNSSLCWIKYVAFHLSKNDHDEARAVGKRALEKINFREDGERLNVHMALFNLENSFGSQEAADERLKEALKCNDQYKIYSQAAAACARMPTKLLQAEKLYKAMARKFCKEAEAWTLLGRHHYTRAAGLKEARFTLQRALQNLEKKHHVEVSSRFAVMEFKHGEAERGKSIFDNIVDNFPKRLDQWNVYVDMVVKNGELEFARQLFDRMIGLNLQPRKMKAVFKKLMDFEESHGDRKLVESVRRKALEYVKTKFGASVREEEEEEDQDPMDQLMELDDD